MRLRHDSKASVHRASAGGRVGRGRRPLAALLLCGAASLPAAAAQPSFLLVDAATLSGQPRLDGCDRAMSAFHAVLQHAGADSTLLTAPTTAALRDALVRFGAASPGAPHALAFCGYAAEDGGNVFALASDASVHDDLALAGVSIRAFSRVAGGAGGLVLLDLHPATSDGALAGAVAGALDGASHAWSLDGSLSGTKIARTDAQPGQATLIDRVVQSGTTATDAIAHAVETPPEPAAAPPAAAQAPVAPDKAVGAQPAGKPVPQKAKPVPEKAPTAADADAAPAAPTPSTAAAASGASATTPGPAVPAPAASGPVALAPPATDAAHPVVPPRPRQHPDEAVRRTQVALLARGLFEGRVTGIDSPAIHTAIRHFQAMLGHPETGQLTPDETAQLSTSRQ